MIKCLNCGRDYLKGEDTCKCGSKDVIYGENFSYKDGKALCECGGTEFKNIVDLDISGNIESNYECVCGNVLGVQRNYTR